MAKPRWLSFANKPDECAIEDSYLMSLVKERYTTEPLPGGFFVFREEGTWISFAVLADVGGVIASDGSTITEGECVFHGEGPSGNLRECRHTFWGEEDNGGYIFYPNGPLIAAAFVQLSKFFDGMVEKKGSR